MSSEKRKCRQCSRTLKGRSHDLCHVCRAQKEREDKEGKKANAGGAGAYYRACPRCGRKMLARSGQEICCKCRNGIEAREDRYGEPGPARKCHTCGKPTNNYWCAECRAKRIARAESDWTGAAAPRQA